MANKHISDEMLAAFLDGNVNGPELAGILKAAQSDREIKEMLDIALRLDDEYLPMFQIAAEGGRNLCDVQCEAYILNKLGIDTTVEELFKVAKDNRWIRRAGVPLYCIGNLIEYKGAVTSRKCDATIEDIMEALNNNHGVITAVDCDKLYPDRPDEEDETNHAIVVIKVDTDSKEITLFDPENSSEVIIPLPLFISAWKESRCFLVSAKRQ